jgi:hypothetical protein
MTNEMLINTATVKRLRKAYDKAYAQGLERMTFDKVELDMEYAMYLLDWAEDYIKQHKR